jgi:regulator of protease activity HflC (stomatin/prohibitin superfamily)
MLPPYLLYWIQERELPRGEDWVSFLRGFIYLWGPFWMGLGILGGIWGTFLADRFSTSFLEDLLIIGGLVSGLYVFQRVIVSRYARQFVKDRHFQHVFSRTRRHFRQRLFWFPSLARVMAVLFRYPLIMIDREDLDRSDRWVESEGGPAILNIQDGFSAYLEQGGHFSRVLGPGYHVLQRFETIRAVLDTRPMTINGQVSTWTVDGIMVEVQFRLVCKVGKEIRERGDRLFPVNPEAVRQVMESVTVKVDPDTGDYYETAWKNGVVGTVQGVIANHITRYYLDELFFLQENEESIRRVALIESVQQQARKRGISVLDLHIARIDLPDAINQQRINFWKADQKRYMATKEGETRAYQIMSLEKARAEAQRDLLFSLIENMNDIERDGSMNELLMYLSEVLDQNLKDPLLRSFITKESLEVLEKVQKMLDKEESS